MNEANRTNSLMSTGYPPSVPLEDALDRFWDVGPQFDDVTTHVAAPDTPLKLLARLGPSPFERGGFPLVGFLATTYEKVTRVILDRV